MADDLLSISNPPDTEQPIGLAPVGDAVLPETAAQRAAKASFGFQGKLDMSYEDYYGYMIGGQESDLRQKAAATLDSVQAQKIQQAFTDYSAINGPPSLSQKEYLRRQVLNNSKFNDPRSVVEDNYAKEYFNHLYGTPSNPSPGGWFADALREIPLHVQSTIDTGSSLLGRSEYWRTQYENAYDATQNQGWVAWGVDQAKQLFQTYTEWKLRQGPSFWKGIGLGSNLEETRQALYRLPYDEMKTKGDEIMQKLIPDNPSVATIFAHAMLGQSLSEQTFNNAMSALVPVELTGIGKALFGMTRSTVKSMLKSSTNIDHQPLKTVAADAVGDLKEAGVQVAATEKSAAEEGHIDATRSSVQPLLSVMRTDDEAMALNPGRNGQEIANRISQDGSAIRNLIERTIELMPQVQRLPNWNKNEALMRAAVDQIRERFTGPASMILDISPLRYNRTVRGLEADLHLGTTSGEFFSSPQEAASVLRANGIAVKMPEGFKTLGDLLAESVVQQKNLKDVKALSALGRIADQEVFTRKVTLGGKEYTQYMPASTARKMSKELEGLTSKSDIGGVEIRQSGKGWYGVVTKPVDVTGDGVRQTILQTEGSSYKNPWWGGRLAKWFTPNENLSAAETANRTVAVYGPSAVKAILSENAKVFNEARSAVFNLGRNEQFQKVLNYSQRVMNPATGKQGKFFNIPELEDHYYRTFGFYPNETEIRGYMAWKRGIEIERVFANMNELAKMHNMGAEQHSIFYTAKDGVKKTVSLVGISRKEIPDRKGALLIVGESEDQHQIRNLQYLRQTNNNQAKALREGIEQGTWKLTEVWNPDFKPFKGFAGVNEEPIRYVLTKNIQTAPLAYEQIPRAEGGHLIYEHKRFIKQPIINRYKIGNKEYVEYAGDRTLFALDDKASGKQWVQNLKEFAQAYKNGDVVTAQQIASRLPIPFSELEQNIKKGFFDLNEDFHIVPRNTRIIEQSNHLYDKYGKDELLDGSRQGSSPARSLTNPYTYEKDVHDLHVLGEEGSVANPTFTYRPAQELDATEAMNRGLARIINSAFMDDYKLSSMEHWYQQAKPYMDAKEFDSLMKHPAYHFYNETDEQLPWLKGADQNKIEQLMSARVQIKGFNGIPSKLDATLDKVAQSMENSIYNSESKTKRVMHKAGLAGLISIRNGANFVRKATFHSVLGLFNPSQFFVQSMTYANILAISPQNAAKGSYAALATQWARLNPSALDHLGKLGETFGWKPGQFKEAYELGQRTGFFTVAGEHSFTGYEYATPKLFQHAAGKFLDAGQFAFKEGERGVRYGAWYTAFQDWAAENIGRKITESDLNSIIARADMYAGNMTKASRSGAQSGLLSWPMQFMGYQLRTAEMMIGKRLTMGERTRLLGMNLAMYGIPAGVGIFGFPFGDSIREAAVKYGNYVEGQYPLVDFLMEGVPHMMIAGVTGERVNFGQRYGYGGVGAIHDALAGDKEWWKWMGGASGSFLINGISNLHPFWMWAVNSLTDQQGTYPLRIEDFTAPMRNISSVNVALREYEALNTGRWLSRNNTYVGDVGLKESLILSATGLQPQAQVQANTLYNLSNQQSEKQKEYSKNAQKQMHRFFDAIKIYDDVNANDYMKRAYSELIRGGVPEEDWQSVFHQATEEYGKTLIERLDWNWYMKHVPPSDFKARLEAYQHKLQGQK